VSSTIRTFTRLSLVNFVIVVFAILALSNVVKRIQLIDDEFINRYTVSFAKLPLCLPVNIFIYIDRFSKISTNKYMNNSMTGIPLLLYALDAFKTEDILYVLKKYVIEEEIFLSFLSFCVILFIA
jgi:hypothetical protein